MAKSSSNTTNNVGILGSIMGMFRFHDVTVCKDDDDSFYCKFMKVFKIIMAIFVLGIILVMVYKIFFTKGGLVFGGKRLKGG